MKAEEFFQVAGLLLADGPYPDGRQRSAVSRFYYSAFLEARDRLKETKNLKVKKHDAHEYVRRAFEWSADKDLKLVGRLLGDLKKLRETADYQTEGTLPASETKEAERLANDIRKTLGTADINACVDPNTHLSGGT